MSEGPKTKEAFADIHAATEAMRKAIKRYCKAANILINADDADDECPASARVPVSDLRGKLLGLELDLKKMWDLSS